MPTRKATIELEWIEDPSVKYTPAQLRRVLARRLYERLVGEDGQQMGVSVESITIKDEKGEWRW